jgi:PPM family protein phosphatase
VTKSSMPELAVAAQTDPGCDPAKAVNEDAYVTCRAACGTLLAVCDGMGGHEGGRVASTTAVQVLQSLFETAPSEGGSSRFLRSIVETAGRAVHALAPNTEDEFRPGSTCVALLFTRNLCNVAHVGDSRAYRFSKGKLERLTTDHSLVNDLVMAGVMAQKDAINHPDAHRITRALGMSAQVVVDVRELTDLASGDRFLLCSDGLTDLVTDDEIAKFLSNANHTELQQICSALIDLAKSRGGHDNITVVVTEIEQLGADATIPIDAKVAEGTLIDVMPIPTKPSSPLQPTVVLTEAGRSLVAPTVVEAAQKATVVTETQPIAVPVIPSAPSSSTPAQKVVPEAWSTQGLPGQPPRSSAKWVLLGAAVTALVILGLLVWALIH